MFSSGSCFVRESFTHFARKAFVNFALSIPCIPFLNSLSEHPAVLLRCACQLDIAGQLKRVLESCDSKISNHVKARIDICLAWSEDRNTFQVAQGEPEPLWVIGVNDRRQWLRLH